LPLAPSQRGGGGREVKARSSLYLPGRKERRKRHEEKKGKNKATSEPASCKGLLHAERGKGGEKSEFSLSVQRKGEREKVNIMGRGRKEGPCTVFFVLAQFEKEGKKRKRSSHLRQLQFLGQKGKGKGKNSKEKGERENRNLFRLLARTQKKKKKKW